MAKRITLALVATVVSLVLLEIGVRLLVKESRYGYPEGLHETHATRGYAYVPGFAGHFPGLQYRGVEIRINSRGLRDVEHDYSKAGGVTRILGLGDSVAFGAGVELEESYLAVLEGELDRAGYPVETVKAGVNGYELDQQLAFFFEEGVKYEADVVVVGVVLNDVAPVDVAKAGQRYGDSGSSRSPFRKLGRVWTSFRIIRERVSGIAGREEAEAGEREHVRWLLGLWRGSTWERYRAGITRLNDHLKRRGTPLVLAVFPYTLQFERSEGYGWLPQGQIASLGVDSNISVVDLARVLDVEGYEGLYLYGDDLHPNAAGHALAAKELARHLIGENLVPRRGEHGGDQR